MIGVTFGIFLKINRETKAYEPWWLGLIYSIYGLFVFIPSLSVWIRRLHDVGKSGWWLLIGFVPLLGLGALYLLYLSIKDGEPGDNRFGLNPKENDLIVG